MFNLIAYLEAQSRPMTAKQVCEMLTVSRTSLQRMVERREIPSFSVGSKRLFDPATLKWWLLKKSPEMSKVSESTSA